MNYKLILHPGSNLVQEFTSIPHGVTSLDLSLNNLYSISTVELIQAFANIPASVTSLNLSGNSLGFKNSDELVQILAAIPANVNSLNLRGNNLASKNCAELAKFLASIPASVTSLDLSANLLGLKSYTELAYIFSSIPNHVVSLNLCLNCLHGLSLENLELLKDSLKPLQTVYLDYDIVKNMSKEQRQALGAVFPNIQKIILVDYYGKELHPSQSITIANLIRELSGKTDVPSLLNQSILFAKGHQTNIKALNIPDELKESIQTCKPL
ncbi:TPA: hypothetical protein JBB31_10565 [Legionella pneumophila subsp. pneumophila]|uniref:hypothetical protein n=1 Tax=Legionella pneumophila TaxID=446 RepID=UPI001A201747|nr:hypothetical protein [Legionella pneumophila]HAT9090004.1 hypothetical protein [Legionella pneumophila subsp. pneumophila]HAT1990452.1 hypothetical protein [Legionella pneumophila]HAT1994217.1 hypothetical protein [Legionella pneumophila]HAT2051864.1 hypothetical protein [Legionella pneumophila]